MQRNCKEPRHNKYYIQQASFEKSLCVEDQFIGFFNVCLEIDFARVKIILASTVPQNFIFEVSL